MSDKDKYTNPATNPLIKIQPFEEASPSSDDEPGPSLEVERLIDLPDIKTGLFPGEKKTAESSSGSDMEKVEALVRAAEILNVYAGGNVLLFKVRQGQGGLIVEESPGAERPINESDVDLIMRSLAAE
jgi:hypothetical protein